MGNGAQCTDFLFVKPVPGTFLASGLAPSLLLRERFYTKPAEPAPRNPNLQVGEIDFQSSGSGAKLATKASTTLSGTEAAPITPRSDPTGSTSPPWAM